MVRAPIRIAVAADLDIVEVDGGVLRSLKVIAFAREAGGLSLVAVLPRHRVPHLSEDVRRVSHHRVALLRVELSRHVERRTELKATTLTLYTHAGKERKHGVAHAQCAARAEYLRRRRRRRWCHHDGEVQRAALVELDLMVSKNVGQLDAVEVEERWVFHCARAPSE